MLKLRSVVELYGFHRIIHNQIWIAIGSVLAALGYSLFQVPINLVAGGAGGIAIIVKHFTNFPVGTTYFLINIPLLIIGFRYLGRWHFIFSTLLSVIIFSISADLFSYFLPQTMARFPITDDLLLNALYAGVVFGLGSGIIFRFGGTIGGTAILGRIINNKTGFPMSQSYFFTDGLIILVAGLIFGWELALLALISLFFTGFASDFVLEGVSQVRTVNIITNKPDELKHEMMHKLRRGISQWSVMGGYSNKEYTMIFCTVSRSQVQDLKMIVAEVNPEAFMVIGVAQQARNGHGFKLLKNPKKKAKNVNVEDIS